MRVVRFLCAISIVGCAYFLAAPLEAQSVNEGAAVVRDAPGAERDFFQFSVPLSLSYQFAFDTTTHAFIKPQTASAVFRRIDLDATFQFLFLLPRGLYIGPEVGVSVSVPSLAIPLTLGFAGIAFMLPNELNVFTSIEAHTFTSTLAGHFPIRMVLNIPLLSDSIDMDIFAGAQFNLARSAIQSVIDLTFDVGTRMYIYNLFVDISYALPVSIAINTTRAAAGFWQNGLTIGIGYRL